MNRFLLFAYEQYYPMGGMDDCVFMSNDPDEVVRQWKLHGDRKSTRLNSSHMSESRMPSSA